MNVNLTELNTKGRVNFEGSPDVSKYYNDYVKSINNLYVSGTIVDNGTEEYEINIHITGDLVLKSVINGSDVHEKMDINNEDYIENLVEKYKNSTNSLDILPIIWENILLEIPIKAANPDDEYESTSGKGWEIVE